MPTELQLDALAATQPRAEDETWQDTHEEIKGDFLKLFCLIGAVGGKYQHSGEALTEFEDCEIPEQQLTPQSWVDWYKKDVLELCPRSFDVFLQVGFVVENPKPKQQVEQGLNMDRINEINDWFWNPV